MFSSLADQVPGATVLDLYAGTGALGIEALSRGAAAATFVEQDRTTAAVLADNIASAAVADRATVVRGAAAAFVARTHAVAFTLVLCDPPYDLALPAVIDVLRSLADAGGLAPGATVVIERDKRDPALRDDHAVSGFLAIDRRRSYGDTVLLYLAQTGEP
jgi:16S rRNA (guanine966-N2)-methyltransferase